MELDDKALLREYTQRNSEEAFAALVTRHLDKVYSVALRHAGNPHQAEEITQAVFVILAKKSGQLGERVILEGWLYQTARLTALTFIRGEIRRARREQEAFMQTSLNENESEVWLQIAPLLDAAMADLNETDRHAVVLRFFYGKSMKEIGDALGGSEGAVRLRLHRALEKLRQFFLKRGIISTTAVIAVAISANSVQAAPTALAKSITAVAITKGVAASGSSSTLIKGALKVMAWTKAKTAIVAGVVAFLVIGGTTTAVMETSTPDIQGTWEGMVTLKGGAPGVQAGEWPKARIVYRVIQTNGGYQVTLDNIDNGIKDAAMTNVVYEHHSLHMEIQEGTDNESFDAKVNFAGTKISGVCKGSNKGNNWSLPLTLHRTTHPPSVPEPLADWEFAPRAGSQLQGYWTGSINSGKNGLRVSVKIAEPSDRTFRADLYVPQQGTNRQPSSVSYDGTTVKLMPMAGYGMFQGELRNGGTEMVGDWIQGGRHTPTSLVRAEWKP